MARAAISGANFLDDSGLKGPGTLVTRQPVSLVACYCRCVMKKTRRTRRSKTHFEQIPVAAVRKIARPDASTTQPTRRHNLVVEPSATKTEPYSLQFVPLYRHSIRHR